MLLRTLASAIMIILGTLLAPGTRGADELIPAGAKIKTDRPRLLLRPQATPYAISLEQFKSTARDDDFRQMLDQLRGQDNAAAQAMVWLLTGDRAAADRAVRKMRAYRFPGSVDTFHIYFRLMEFALAYDWLYRYEGFTDAIKAEVRAGVLPLARHGLRQTDDHVFHNYIWMSAGGTALWALAVAGEDDESDRLAAGIFARLNRGLYPAMRYLDGLPSEPMGYWAQYDFAPAALALMAAQSAFETDLAGKVQREQGDWLRRHFDNLVHSTLPNMRFVPWGDLQSGPNGGVTHEMAGVIDAVTWALRSPHGAYFSGWLAERRGLRRFYGETAVFYMLYTRHLNTEPAVPPLSFLAGRRQSGHFIARSGWDDGATIVTLRATDHFGDHNHYDQGSFMIYRNGLLAVDPPVYRRIRGPQQITGHHNTLLLAGKPQRPARGQWFKTVEAFQDNLDAGRMLETADMPFSKDAGAWAAASCQFAQAYDPELLLSCVRQLLLVRPGTVAVVDHLTAPAGRDLPQLQWLLQLPTVPTVAGQQVWAANESSWIRCRPVLPGGSAPEISETPVGTHRVSYAYRSGGTLWLVHVLEVGDGRQPAKAAEVSVRRSAKSLDLVLDGKTYRFAAEPPFAVSCEP